MGRYNRTVRELEQKLSRHRSQLAELERAQKTLRMRAAAVDLALRTVEALINLGQRLGWPWGDVDADDGGAPAWWNELRRMRSELEGLRRPDTPAADAAAAWAPSTAPPSDAEHGVEVGAHADLQPCAMDATTGTSSDGESSAMSGICQCQVPPQPQQRQQEGLPDHIPLGWSPADAAARALAAAAAGDFTTEGLRRCMLSYAALAGTLLPRIRNAAPDAHAAAQRLQQEKARLHEHGSLILMQKQDPGCVSALSYILTRPLVEGAPTDTPNGKHWEWAVSQTKLKPWQEELLWELLALWQARIARITLQREELLALCCDAPAGDTGQQAEAVARLSALQQQYQVLATVFVNACNCSIMDTEQFAAYFTSSMPWCPSLTALHAVLATRRKARAVIADALNGGGGGSSRVPWQQRQRLE